jgi:hypothetical protein
MLPIVFIAFQALAANQANVPSTAQLPDSDAGRAWASVGPETEPISLATELLEAEPWLREPQNAEPALVWSRWGQWVAAERERELTDPRERCALLLLASSDQRWSDAWSHFARLGAAPQWAAAALPHLFLGLPIEHPTTAGGQPGPMADGVLLSPAPPPAPPGVPRGSLVLRQSSFPGLRIGAAIVDMRITLEPSGVQVDLTHVGGGPAHVRVLLPEPEGYEIRVEYIDWMREDVRRGPLELELLPGSDQHSLFGRFSERRERLPAMPRGLLPGSLKRGGLWLEAEGDLELEMRPFATHLGVLFGLPTGTCSALNPPPASPWTRTICHVGSSSIGRARFMTLVSLAEAYALRKDR